MAKDSYEISLWEDSFVAGTYSYVEIINYTKLVEEDIGIVRYYLYNDEYQGHTITSDDVGKTLQEIILPFVGQIPIWYAKSVDTPGHFEEFKLAVIGSDTMTSECRAIEPRFTPNINGTKTFTFKMFYKYHNPITGEYYDNPFLNLLVNERKVKIYWQNDWHDLIIKNIQETSNGKSLIYTCADANINELSKTGFELIFDDNLNKTSFTNQGTAQELAEHVLEGTDWIVDRSSSDTVQQTIDEPVYTINLNSGEVLSNVYNQTKNEAASIEGTATLLLFYSQIQAVFNSDNSTGSFTNLQFAYAKNYSRDANSQLVINADCYKFTNSITWSKDTNNLTLNLDNSISKTISLIANVSNEYRAKRLVESQISVKDNLTGKTCYVYIAPQDGRSEYSSINAGDEIYEYIGYEFGSAHYVNNLVCNANAFLNVDGWDCARPINFAIYPVKQTTETHPTSYLQIQVNGTTVYCYNDGLKQCGNYIKESIKKAEKYVLRYKIKTNKLENGLNVPHNYVTTSDCYVTPRICTYKVENNHKVPATSSVVDYFSISSPSISDNWIEYTLTCTNSFTASQVYSNQIGLFLSFNNGGSGQTKDAYRYIEDIELFPLVTDSNGARINPGDFSKSGIVQTNHVYFNHTKSVGLISTDDIEFLYSGTTDWDKNIGTVSNPIYLKAKINDNFCKIRSITAKNSNRFNILQSIAETFECWIKFVVEHDSTGKIIYDESGRPKKSIQIVNEVGIERGVGFVYGIDLQTISRTIASDSIVTKTIVSKNDNEFAENGSCMISRSKFNYPLVDYIYNFDYYINQGLLDGNQLNKDLYVKLTSDEEQAAMSIDGFYYWMHNWNEEYAAIALELANKQIELAEDNAKHDAYTTALSSISETIVDYQNQLITLSSCEGAYTDAKIQNWIAVNRDSKEVQPRLAAIASQEILQERYQAYSNELDAGISTLEDEISFLDQRKSTLTNYIKTKSILFYKKYARFIQEGSWTSQDYSDDNLYYLDAQSVAYTSSRPQISYNISVLRVSGIDGFELKDFHLGDISFIQDTDFFGYIYPIIDNVAIKTPYKEKVLVSEITYNFDEPQKDTFKVQNYKTQFEDLFQRITATTQSLQYESGSYAKAASIVETDGTINEETLAASISTNASVLNHTSLSQSVITDDQGITVSNLANPSQVVRITAGGIFISTDGGETWKNAIRGEGLSTQYLTTGSINTSNISIMDGAFSTFRWDSSGINAYDVVYVDGEKSGYNLSKFVRFDHFGTYGINDPTLTEGFYPVTEQEIWDTASFGLTWEGFFVKNKYDDHYVEISSKNDIQVVETSGTAPIDRVKIGKLGDNLFGFRIKDSNGNTVLETPADGHLWLEKELKISSTDNEYDVEIGYLNKYKALGSDIHQIFNANDKFIVNEDGSIKATDGEFTGIIYATSGRIGNLTINDIEEVGYKVNITSNAGTVIKNQSGDKVLTATLYRGGTAITTGVTYQWYKDNVQLSGATNQTYTVAASTFGADAVHTYTCSVALQN